MGKSGRPVTSEKEGPSIMPAIISPTICGCPIRRAIQPNSRAARSIVPTETINCSVLMLWLLFERARAQNHRQSPETTDNDRTAGTPSWECLERIGTVDIVSVRRMLLHPAVRIGFRHMGVTEHQGK